MDVSVFLPAVCIDSVTFQKEAILDINSLSIESTYNGQKFEVQWLQNNTYLTLNVTDLQNIAPKPHVESNSNENHLSEDVTDRLTRSIENRADMHFNRYLQKVIETEHNETERSDGLSEILPSYLRSENALSTNDRIVASLPANRTIYFDCGNQTRQLCLEEKFRVTNIKASNQPILIIVNFTIDMTKVAKIMTNQKDIFVVRTSVELTKVFDEDT